MEPGELVILLGIRQFQDGVVLAFLASLAQAPPARLVNQHLMPGTTAEVCDASGNRHV
jgi:hypothetical protein